MSKINYFSVACPRPPAPLQVLPVPRKIIYFPQDKIFIIKLLLYLLIKQFFLQISHLFVVKLSIYLHHEKKLFSKRQKQVCDLSGRWGQASVTLSLN